MTNTNSSRRPTPTSRPPSYISKRLSSYQSKNSSQSRPTSHVFPTFHSSLPYTLVRDFAYPTNHPYHYGPPPNNSGLSTPASETRRLSDPAIQNWDDNRGQWAATPPWTTENAGPASQGNTREQLPAMTYSDGGPPYPEDEDLHSPVVTTSRHKKSKSSINDRGRSPGTGNGNGNRGLFVGVNGDGSKAYYVNEENHTEQDADGPGGEIVTYPPDQARQSLLSPEYDRSAQRRDSHFATSLRRPSDDDADFRSNESDDDYSEAGDESRFSRNYSFSISSPDEEMHGRAVALFDFESEHENELPLAEGQIILVSYRHGQGWLVAQDPKTGESGLVPEEFVRLIRDIEGGLNGLTAQMDDLLSPASENAATPTVSGGGFRAHEKKLSNGATTMEKQPAMQSTFSISSKDLEKYPLQKDKDDTSTPTLPSHPLRNELVDNQRDKENNR